MGLGIRGLIVSLSKLSESQTPNNFILCQSGLEGKRLTNQEEEGRGQGNSHSFIINIFYNSMRLFMQGGN